MSEDREDNSNKYPGRPKGYKLSKESREKIRQHKLGSRLSKKTKDKISSSLSAYFRRKRLLADSLKEEYIESSEEAANWIENNKKSIDDSDNIITKRRLTAISHIEINLGFDINNIGHNADPEFILLLKESLSQKGDKEALRELYSLVL